MLKPNLFYRLEVLCFIEVLVTHFSKNFNSFLNIIDGVITTNFQHFLFVEIFPLNSEIASKSCTCWGQRYQKNKTNLNSVKFNLTSLFPKIFKNLINFLLANFYLALDNCKNIKLFLAARH